ncbi:MAG: PadR family transcriptional regulator [Saccharothrix sp.]|nr:PadR family transcriptional regulator [Saccharothrix sp.]NUT97546.1 PadR family transcriptional regulator [Saccharothrix sp.]
MSLRHAVLGLLAHGPASGYDLLKTFEGSLANAWPATQSQLYGELNKLADSGYVTVAAEGPRGRKEYAITEAGRAELHHWMTEVEPERVRRSDMLLRVFFLDLVDHEEALEYLRREAEGAAERHAAFAELARVVDSTDDPLAEHGRIALEWGLRFTKMQQEWAEWARRRMA